MYELVNTSLPNGLIAGTHGFATVAMTKGVSDVLRGRLEALCAYTHRTSAHDTTYYQQNPVNWFHIVLPHGEHVVGRVAPSEFDYTGRTNRLAKLRIFGAQEMPSVGAADVLQKEKTWFSQEWQGDPRYLDEDRNTCGHLRMLNPVQASSAPAWDALFGANGSRLAQQFAWQLEKNVSSGGKAIYFKTTASFDVSGERMLGLFADLINLLPPELKDRAVMISGKMTTKKGKLEREQAIEDMRTGKKKYLFATYSLAAEGMDGQRDQIADVAVSAGDMVHGPADLVPVGQGQLGPLLAEGHQLPGGIAQHTAGLLHKEHDSVLTGTGAGIGDSHFIDQRIRRRSIHI